MDWLESKWLGKTDQAEKTMLRSGMADFLLEERALTQEDYTFHNPFLLGGMKEAVRRLSAAIDRQEKVMIHGDYDVDGLSSTALMKTLLERFGLAVLTYIPNRLEEGYGLQQGGVEECVASGASLLITVDCGIRSVEEVAYLVAKGVDVIVTDHHEPGDTLPTCTAVIDPHIEGETYPFIGLAGAGVALKLAQALCLFRGTDHTKDLAALATLGTVADVMVLGGENRLLVKTGLKELAAGALPGIQTLLARAASEGEPITARRLAYDVSPMLNAAGRMGDSKPALDLLLVTDLTEAARLTLALRELNLQRKEAEAQVLAEIGQQMEENPAILGEKVLVLRGQNWHPGVLGIVASRIKERYHRPCLVFSLLSGEIAADGTPLWRGSGRTEGEVDLLQLVSQAADFLDVFGGHKQALGLAVSERNWASFCQRIHEVGEALAAESGGGKPREIFYDCQVAPEALSLEEVEALAKLEPFGKGNEEPLCLFPDYPVMEASRIGKDKTHLRLKFPGPYGPVTAIAFGKGVWADLLKPGQKVSLLGTLEINVWRDKRSVQIIASDLKFEGEMAAALAEEKPTVNVLAADDLYHFWQKLALLLQDGPAFVEMGRFARLLTYTGNCVYAPKQVESMHHIFLEAGLVEVTASLGESTLYLQRQEPRTRAKLSETTTAKRLLREGGLRL